MEYKKIETDSYNIHFIKTDKFKKIKIRVNFKEKIEKDKIAYRNMLSLILLEATKKYTTRRLLDIECEELYNISVGGGTSLSGNYQILKFDTSFLNEKYTEENMVQRSTQFFFDFIFEPNIINEEFEIQTFNNAKNILKSDIESYNDNPTRYAYSRLYENMCPNSIISYCSAGYIEDLEEMTPKKLYDYYKKLLQTNLIDIFVVGNFDFIKMEKIIKDKFVIKAKLDNKISHFIKQTDFKSVPVEVIETKDINQSILILAAKIEEMSSFEREYVLVLFDIILGGSPDSKLFKEVREKNSLCYNIGSNYSNLANLFYVKAGIDEVNSSKTIELVKQEINKMLIGDFTDEELLQAKTMYLASLKELEDSENSMINSYEAHEYLNYDLPVEKAKKIVEVTREDIINIGSKIHMDTIFLLKGEHNE